MAGRIAATVVLTLALAACGGSGDGNSGGSGGGSGSGGSGGSGGGSSGPGRDTIEGGWRPASIHFTAIQTSPFQLIDQTVDAPESFPDTDEDTDYTLQILKKIEGTTVTTYTRALGKDVVLRQTEMLIGAGSDTYSVGGGLMAFKDRHPVFTHVFSTDSSTETMDVTWDAADTVPPADWPTQYVDAP